MKRSTTMWLTIALTLWIKLGFYLYYPDFFIWDWVFRQLTSMQDALFFVYLLISFITGLVYLCIYTGSAFTYLNKLIQKLNKYIDEN